MVIALRPMVPSDLVDLVRWRNIPEVNRYLADRLKTMEDAEPWFTRLSQNPKVWLRVVQLDNRSIGYAAVESIDEKNRKCELGLVVGDTTQWGKGIGSQVVRQMLAYAFEDLKMHRVFGAVMHGNERSERMLRRFGFSLEGRMREAIVTVGQYSDLLCFSLLEEEYRATASGGKAD